MGAVLLGGVAVVGLYALRKPIAEHYVDAELAKRGVKGSYQLTQLDPYHQRLEHAVIGDPAHPDLTADWVELSTSIGFGGASVDVVRAGGMRVRGVLDKDGGMHFGALDKFRSTEPGPFKMPDIGLDLADTRVALATPYGDITARLDGKGNLAHDFDGKLGVQTGAITVGGCAALPTNGPLDLTIRSGRPRLKGSIQTASLACADTLLTNPVLTPDVTFSPDLKGVQGTLGLSTDKLASPLLNKAAGALSGAKDTPLAPFGAQYSTAILALGAGLAVKATVSDDPAQGVMIKDITGQSRSGAQFTLADGGSVKISPAGKLTFDGLATLAGGGFPDSNVLVAGTPEHFSGTATLATLSAAATRLALTPLQFAHDARGTRFATNAAFDGPIPGGTVRGLTLPIAALIDPSGSFAMTSPCTPLAFASLSISTLTLGKTATTVCQNGKDIRINAPHLAGKYGTDAFAVAAAALVYNQSSKMLIVNQIGGQLGTTKLSATDARYSLANKQFSVSHIAAQAGTTGHLSTLTADAVSGMASSTAATGRYTNASGRLPSVPLALSNSSGTWRYAQGALVLNGNLNIADTDPAKRFEPLVSPDVVLRYANGLITATGTLNEPKSGAFVSKVSITHTLSAGAGDATIAIKDMPLLSFGKALQPEALTRVTLGVVANLKGAISGEGRIHWSDKGVTSDGHFATEHMDLAAAFGPVKGLKGEIVFTDLLGMVTAPNQVVTIESVNPGVDVENGVIHYRLLPGNKAEIEGGAFPFAGGNLILEPTVLDLSEAAERRLTFRVDGVDAAKFLNEYKFEDVAATGIFDGELPLVFTSAGGRIEAGRLAVRDAGGTVSYVGPVSNASLGTFGKLAFDALKSIKYRGLTIDLQGPLDGEMVTLVKLSGTNQVPLSAQKNFILKQITNIPFKFNIRITAPFRSLLTSAHNLQDPSDLVQQTLPKNLKASAPPPEKKPVNPPATSIQK